MAKRPAGCVRKKIVIKKKGGRVVATFMGRQGKGCGPRRKPSAAALRPWSRTMKTAAPQCARRGGGVKAFRRCVGQAMKSIHG